MLFFRCLVRAFFVLNTLLPPSIGHLNISLLTACFVVMFVPNLPKHLLQIGHFCGSFTMNSGASLLHCEHKSFHSALSCAVCAQILMSSFGKPVSTDRACETIVLRRPVLFCPAFYKAEEGSASYSCRGHSSHMSKPSRGSSAHCNPPIWNSEHLRASFVGDVLVTHLYPRDSKNVPDFFVPELVNESARSFG